MGSLRVFFPVEKLQKAAAGWDTGDQTAAGSEIHLATTDGSGRVEGPLCNQVEPGQLLLHGDTLLRCHLQSIELDVHSADSPAEQIDGSST